MIETNSATITSVTVTIKALKVNNRQMTQAVFTQLPKLDDFTNDDGGLAGNVWGWVNYCPRGERPDDRQFVIEADGILYRAASPVHRISLLDPKTWDGETASNAALLDQFLLDLALVTVAQAIRDKAERNPHVWREGMNLGTFTPFGDIHVCRVEGRYYAGQHHAAAKIWSDCGQAFTLEREDLWNLDWSAHHGGEWYDGCDDFLKAMEGKTVSQERACVTAQISDMVADIDQTNEIRDILRDADQLFIAV
jgi:hypothetical protein